MVKKHSRLRIMVARLVLPVLVFPVFWVSQPPPASANAECQGWGALAAVGNGTKANNLSYVGQGEKFRAEFQNVVARVHVETNKQAYQQDEKIIVTITNNLDTSITTFDQQAFCTIIGLEQQSALEWKRISNCLFGVPSRFVTLKPHTETNEKLSPSPPSIPGISTGTYRASILFSVGETFNFGRSFVSSSLPFRVQ